MTMEKFQTAVSLKRDIELCSELLDELKENEGATKLSFTATGTEYTVPRWLYSKLTADIKNCLENSKLEFEYL